MCLCTASSSPVTYRMVVILDGERTMHEEVISAMHGTSNHRITRTASIELMCMQLRSAIYYIPSLMSPPVQERSFFSGDGEEHCFKKETITPLVRKTPRQNRAGLWTFTEQSALSRRDLLLLALTGDRKSVV